MQEIRKMTGFDRVMLYKFSDDGHGSVIAEEKTDALESYLGLHYPTDNDFAIEVAKEIIKHPKFTKKYGI